MSEKKREPAAEQLTDYKQNVKVSRVSVDAETGRSFFRILVFARFILTSAPFDRYSCPYNVITIV